MEGKSIVVIGSSNTDMTIKAESLPKPGETVIGGVFYMSQGGKGANQAVAAARLGGKVTFICKVGSDQFGDQSLDCYDQEGIDTSLVSRCDGVASGVALITVDSNAENCIVVASGANACLSEDDIIKARAEIGRAGLVLMQMETPVETIGFVTEIAAAAGVRVILNPAPAMDIPDRLLKMLYIITPNKTEAGMLSGVEVVDWESACRAADVIAGRGVPVVIITLGAQGALVRDGGSYHRVEAEKVEAVDTTGAGDTFSGALCVALSEGASILDAVRFACKASAISVTRMGAQTSIPTRDEVDAAYNLNTEKILKY